MEGDFFVVDIEWNYGYLNLSSISVMNFVCERNGYGTV